MTPDRPNILFIMTDQHRFDCLGCMGHREVQTPNLDALAAESVVFDAAYTPSPICAPARAALFSGRYPPGSGVVANWAAFDPTAILLPEHLKNSGYRTGSVGKLHFVPHLKSWGFDIKRLHDAPSTIYANDAGYSDYIAWLRTQTECADSWVKTYDDDEAQYDMDGDLKRFILGSNHVPEPLHMQTWTCRESLAVMSELSSGPGPFFEFVSFFGPHHPYAVPGEWASLYDPSALELPSHFSETLPDCPIFQKRKGSQAKSYKERFSEEEYRRMIAAYYANISMIDADIGKIIEALKKSGKWDDTVIVFTSDHGDYAGQYGLFFKGDVYEAAARVPLMIKLPRQARAGTRISRPVSTLDLYGTLLDAAGNADWQTPDIESKSLWSELTSPEADGPSEEIPVYSIIGRDPDHNHCMIRQGRWKLIRQARGEAAPLYELFDLEASPFEKTNLADDPALQSVFIRLKESLDSWWSSQKGRYPAIVRSAP